MYAERSSYINMYMICMTNPHCIYTRVCIVVYTSALVKSATAAQKELVAQGKLSSAPHSEDSHWSEGLVCTTYNVHCRIDHGLLKPLICVCAFFLSHQMGGDSLLTRDEIQDIINIANDIAEHTRLG